MLLFFNPHQGPRDLASTVCNDSTSAFAVGFAATTLAHMPFSTKYSSVVGPMLATLVPRRLSISCLCNLSTISSVP